MEKSQEIERCIDETVSSVVAGNFEVSELRAFNAELGNINKAIRKGEGCEEDYLQNAESLEFMHQVANGALRKVRSERRLVDLRIQSSLRTNDSVYSSFITQNS